MLERKTQLSECWRSCRFRLVDCAVMRIAASSSTLGRSDLSILYSVHFYPCSQLRIFSFSSSFRSLLIPYANHVGYKDERARASFFKHSHKCCLSCRERHQWWICVEKSGSRREKGIWTTIVKLKGENQEWKETTIWINNIEYSWSSRERCEKERLIYKLVDVVDAVNRSNALNRRLLHQLSEHSLSHYVHHFYLLLLLFPILLLLLFRLSLFIFIFLP